MHTGTTHGPELQDAGKGRKNKATAARGEAMKNSVLATRPTWR